MERIYDKAKELAELIARSDAYRKVRETEQAVSDNPEVRGLVDRYNEHAAKIAEKEKNQQPVEPEEKRELRSLQAEVQSNEKLQELLKAQTDYAMLMNKVNRILRERLEGKNAG